MLIGLEFAHSLMNEPTDVKKKSISYAWGIIIAHLDLAFHSHLQLFLIFLTACNSVQLYKCFFTGKCSYLVGKAVTI